MECESDYIEEPIVIISCTDSPEDWKKSVFPTTIFQLLHADHSSEQDTVLIDGRKIGLVSIVAHVISMEERLTNCKFILSDGTGQISALRSLASVEARPSPEKEQMEKDTYTALVGSYIGAIGKLKILKGRLFLDLLVETQIHKVLDFHQVVFHTLNAMHIHVSRPYDTPRPRHVLQVENSVGLMRTISGPCVSHPVTEDVRARPGTSLNANLDVDVQVHRLASLLLDKGKEDWEHIQHTSVPAIASSILQAVQELGGFSNNRLLSLRDIQEALHNCNEDEFVDAIHYLLDEAYLTSPLDNGYVMITPRD